MVAKIDNEILLENHAFNIRHATIHSLAEGLGARVTWDTTEFILEIKPNNKFFFDRNGNYSKVGNTEYNTPITRLNVQTTLPSRQKPVI